MLAVLVASLLTTSAASPAAAPPSAATADLIRAVDDLERRSRDEAARSTLARAREVLRKSTIERPQAPSAAPSTPPPAAPADPPPPSPADVARAAEAVADIAPDNPFVHRAALQVLLEAVERGATDPGLRQRLRARALAFVERNAAEASGHDVLATVLLAQGDEEGQLRVLLACGPGCRGRFLEAARVWQRPRCTGDGVARGLTLRMGKDILGEQRDVLFLEPVPAVPASPATAEIPAACLLQLDAGASARLASRTAGLTRDAREALIVQDGLMLVSDALLDEPVVAGRIQAPAAVCERLCRAPLPRPLPAGISLEGQAGL